MSETLRFNNKKKKKSSISNKILIFLLIILIGLIVGIVYKTKQNGGGVTGLLSVLVGHDEETLKKLETIQVLLMGVSTDNGGKLTDTIMIGSYDPKSQNASLLSIPRDTFVGKNPQTGTGSDKINSLYQRGPEVTLEKVNELTGLDIKYYMVIDNQALIDLVDIIGGVDFSENSKEINDILISLSQTDSRNKSSKFATYIVNEMKKSVSLVNDTHRFAGFAVLKAPDIPSALLELGYLSNKSEENLLKQSSYRKKLAASVSKAVDRYFKDPEVAALY